MSCTDFYVTLDNNSILPLVGFIIIYCKLSGIFLATHAVGADISCTEDIKLWNNKYGNIQ